MFFFGRPTGRPEPNGYMPDRLPVDRAGRPASLPAANDSFLFGENLNSDFHPILWQVFSEFLGVIF